MTPLRAGSANVKDTLSNAAAYAALIKVSNACDVLGLQEWPGKRNRLLSDQGALVRGPIIRKRKLPETGWTWTRPLIGGGPIGARVSTATLKTCHARVLVGPGRVEGTAEAGVPRKGFLGPSLATVARWDFADIDPEVVLIDVHLTAEVQRGKSGYRTDMPLRVARHKRERKALQRIVNRHLAKGRLVLVLGDTNFHEMEIDGLTGWWDCADKPARDGTEGDRIIDIVSASWAAPTSVHIFASKSDHRHPVATWSGA